MQFGYFTLSDNHYNDNTRTANALIADILDEAVYAEESGSIRPGSASIISRPWASSPVPIWSWRRSPHGPRKSAWRRRSRCCRCTIRSASRSNGRHWICCPAAASILPPGGVTTGANTDRSAPRSTTTSRSSRRGWRSCGALWSSAEPITHHGKHYRFDDVAITPQPVQRPIPAYVASFSKPSIELAGRLGCNLIVAPFAAAMTFGGLKQVADVYREACLRHGNQPGRLMCSYFLHFADNPAEEAAARARQVRYYRECAVFAFPGDPKTAPPSYRYFSEIVERLHKVRPEDLSENAVLLGSPAQIIETLKKVEEAGIAEVILYVAVGLKPHTQVKHEMARFMAEVAPEFAR